MKDDGGEATIGGRDVQEVEKEGRAPQTSDLAERIQEWANTIETENAGHETRTTATNDLKQ